MSPVHDRKRGTLFLLASAFSFSTMNVFARLAGDIPVMQKMFFRNLVAIVIISFILKRMHIPPRIHPGTLRQHLLRSFLGTVCTLGNFYAVDHMLLSDASILVQLSPFFVILLSSVFLHEKVRPTQYLLIMLAFAGAVFVVKPSAQIFTENAALIALFSSVLGGGAYMMVRALSLSGENGYIIVFFFSAFSCIVCFPSMILQHVPYTPMQFLMLLLMSVAACFGQFFVTAAYRYAPGSEISIFDYSQVVFAAIYGWLIFGQVADVQSLIGYALIILAALMMFLQSRRAEAAG